MDTPFYELTDLAVATSPVSRWPAPTGEEGAENAYGM